MSDPSNHVEARASKRIGLLLRGKWRLDSLLGVGGMAAVYAATHRNGKRVAVKVLHPELGTHAEARQRFLREGYVANKVNHPGAVSVLDDDTLEDGSAFLVMELLDGQSLDAFALQHGGRVGSLEVLLLSEQLLDVLETAHQAGIVHRDIKPANVFLTSEGKVKVLDFGIARLRDAAQKAGATVSGVSMGTPSFMAPEQARGRWELVDAQTDVWAIGATMLVLLTGRDVHQAGTLNELLLAAMTKPAPSLASLAPEISPRIAEIVDRALAFDKTGRWPTAAAMRDAVRATYEALSGHPVSAAPRLAPLAPAVAAVSQQGSAMSDMPTTPGISHVTRPRAAAARGAPRPETLGLIAGAVLVVGLGIGFGVWRLAPARTPAPATSGALSAVPPTPEPAAAPDATPVVSASGGTGAVPETTAAPTVEVITPPTARTTVPRKPPPPTPRPRGTGSILDKRTR